MNYSTEFSRLSRKEKEILKEFGFMFRLLNHIQSVQVNNFYSGYRNDIADSFEEAYDEGHFHENI